MTIFDFNDIHSHTPGNGRVLSVDITDPCDIARIVPEQYFTVGVHPWHADRLFDQDLFERLIGSPYCVGIGECGIDLRRGPEIRIQECVLRRQLDMAQTSGLPVVLHIVGAVDRLLALRKEYGQDMTWIVHGFRGKAATARQLCDAGIHISLGKKYQSDIVDSIATEFIHRETD